MKTITLTKTDGLIRNGWWTEWYWVNAKIAKGLAGMVDCEDVVIKDTAGNEYIENKYALSGLAQDSKGRWIAEFSTEVASEDETESETDVRLGCMIEIDVAMAVGLTEDQIEINWRGQK